MKRLTRFGFRAKDRGTEGEDLKLQSAPANLPPTARGDVDEPSGRFSSGASADDVDEPGDETGVLELERPLTDVLPVEQADSNELGAKLSSSASPCDASGLGRSVDPCEGADKVIWTWCLREMLPWMARRIDYSRAVSTFEQLNSTRKSVFLLNIHDGQVILENKPANLMNGPIKRAGKFRDFIQKVVELVLPRHTDKDCVVFRGRSIW